MIQPFNLSISFLLISLPLSSPLRVMYSGLELQWILPSLYYITGKSFIFTFGLGLRPGLRPAGINVINSPRGVYRGIYNYLIQNAMRKDLADHDCLL